MALFETYRDNSRGMSPVVVNAPKTNMEVIGGALEEAGKIPGNMQQAQFKQMLTELMMKAIGTNPTTEQRTPTEIMNPDVEFSTDVPHDVNILAQKPGMGDFLTKGPDKITKSTNPAYQDIQKKLETLGIYHPGSSASSRESIPDAIARAGGIAKAQEEAKEPDRIENRQARKEARDLINDQRADDRDARISQAGDTRRAKIDAQDNLVADRAARLEELKQNNIDRNAIYKMHAEIQADRVRQSAADDARRGESDKANQKLHLQQELTKIQDSIKRPPSAGGRVKPEWDMDNELDRSQLEQYIQTENNIMNDLEKLGVPYPGRRELKKVNDKQMSVARGMFGLAPTQSYEITPKTVTPQQPNASTTTQTAPTRTAPEIRGRTPGASNALGTTITPPSTIVNETPEERKGRLQRQLLGR